MKDSDIKEHIKKGAILARVIFEIAGNPKEHVEQSLKKYIAVVKEDPAYIFLKEEYAPCEEHDGVWSMFLEADVLVMNFEKLNSLCFNLGPASIEIIEPVQITLTQKQLSEWYTDLASKIHEVSIYNKSLNSENDLLKVNLSRAIKNCIILALHDPKNEEDLAKKVGIEVEKMHPFLDIMIKEKTIVKEDTIYRLVR